MAGTAGHSLLRAVEISVSMDPDDEHVTSIPDYMDEDVSMKVSGRLAEQQPAAG